MPEQIMTIGRQTKELILRGKDTTLIADFREIPFQCNFVSGAVNGVPQIRVTVFQVGKPRPEQIRIQLIPPDRPSRTLSGQPLVYRVAQPSNRMPPRPDTISPAGDLPPVVFKIDTGFNPNRFTFDTAGDIFTDPIPPDLIDPLPDPIPPGGGSGSPSRQVFIYPLTPGVDPEGRWVVKLTL